MTVKAQYGRVQSLAPNRRVEALCDRRASSRDAVASGRIRFSSIDEALAMKTYTVTITSPSTAGSSTKDYRTQLVKITSAPDELAARAGKRVNRRSRHIRVFWKRGTADDLKNATSVTLLDENRGFAFEGQLSMTANPPHDVPDGVEFFLVRADKEKAPATGIKRYG